MSSSAAAMSSSAAAMSSGAAAIQTTTISTGNDEWVRRTMLDPECWNGVRELGRAEDDEEDDCECERECGDERNEGGTNDDDEGTECET